MGRITGEEELDGCDGGATKEGGGGGRKEEEAAGELGLKSSSKSMSSQRLSMLTGVVMGFEV